MGAQCGFGSPWRIMMADQRRVQGVAEDCEARSPSNLLGSRQAKVREGSQAGEEHQERDFPRFNRAPL